MTNDKETEVAENEGLAPAAHDDSVVPAPSKEPKQTRAKSAGAKPETAPVAPYAVFGGGTTDPVLYSRTRPPKRGEGRNVLSVVQLQRKLQELGHNDARADKGGYYGAGVTRAVAAWQASKDHAVTGVLTREEFAELWEGDVNVDALVDTPADH